MLENPVTDHLSKRIKKPLTLIGLNIDLLKLFSLQLLAMDSEETFIMVQVGRPQDCRRLAMFLKDCLMKSKLSLRMLK